MTAAERRTDPLSADRRQRALALVARGDLPAATECLKEELGTGEAGRTWATDVIIHAMQADDLGFAGDFAQIIAGIRYAGRVPRFGASNGRGDDLPSRPEIMLSAGKLRHDVEQFRYLQAAGLFDDELDPVIERYVEIAQQLDKQGPETRLPLSDQDLVQIGTVYSRLLHVRNTPRLPRALSSSWNPVDVERHYRAQRLGVVVIDDFLVADALSELQKFCVESTVWNANRYPNGRLGAFFDAGFNCPLLLQIAEELRASFPTVIGDRHRLRQLWGFKYPPQLPADSTIHADFAAVNVNFWVSSDSANRDPATGGLVIYNVDAPRDWDFVSYNERLDLIKEFLRQSGADVIRIPYRENRAIIFNSDLFHATDRLDFSPDYIDRRVNITMLYGVREQDDLHPDVAGRRVSLRTELASSMWRSAAFSRTRRRV